MGEVGRVFRKIILLVAAGVCVYLTLYNANDMGVSVVGTFYIVDEYVPTYYEMLSDNVGITTENGISNVYVNMSADGYSIYNEVVTSNSVDVSFVKDRCPSYRYYYSHPDGRVTFFCSDYESSFTGLAYIIDRKE